MCVLRKLPGVVAGASGWCRFVAIRRACFAMKRVRSGGWIWRMVRRKHFRGGDIQGMGQR